MELTLVGIGLILVVISLLLWTYYSMKANEDDLNRPSFFNSKLRKYFLFCLILIFFLTGSALFILEGYYNLVWLLPLFYYISYYFIRRDWQQKLIITRIFKYYRAFVNPDLSMTQKDQLTAPILFMCLEMKTPLGYQNKVKNYLEERVDEGKIKSVRDLPNEAWIILNSVRNKDIDEKSIDKIPQSKIDYYYQEIFEDKEHHNFSKKLVNWLWNLEASFDRNFSNFSFVCLPRPDFTERDLQLVEGKFFKKGDKIGRQSFWPVFPDVSFAMSRKMGWIKNYEEYCALAALEFQRRFPKHKFSEKIKKMHKYTDQQIFDYAQNWQKLNTDMIDLSNI